MGDIPRYILINEYDVTVKKDNTGEIISHAKAQLEVMVKKYYVKGKVMDLLMHLIMLLEKM